MTTSTRRILVLAVAAGGVALAFLLRARPAIVETSRVELGAMQVTVEEEGKTRVRDRFVVSSPVAGRLARIALREGDAVEERAVVARLAPVPLDERARAEARARLQAAIAAERAAQARVRKARTVMEQARRDHGRADELAAAGTIPAGMREQAELSEETMARDLESALFAARAAAFDVEAARSALMAAESDRQNGAAAELIVRAPVTGRILRILQESERSVAAGTPLVEIGDPAKLEIVLDLLSSDAVKVRPGAPMLVQGGEGRPLRARVRTVEPSAFTKVSALGVEEQRVNVIADFIEPAGRLGDGYRVEAAIILWEGADVVRAPASSLFRRDSNWAAFVVEGGRARRRNVVVGQRNSEVAQIVRGLRPGEVVIVHPGDGIEEGSRVRPSG